MRGSHFAGVRRLTEFPDLTHLGLRQLALSFNQIQTLPASLADYDRLLSLDLSTSVICDESFIVRLRRHVVCLLCSSSG